MIIHCKETLTLIILSRVIAGALTVTGTTINTNKVQSMG